MNLPEPIQRLSRRLLFRFFLPLILSAILLGGIAIYIVRAEVYRLFEHRLQVYAEGYQHDLQNRIDATSLQALRIASLFSELPAVREALMLAAQGNPDDETDPYHQAAREALRRDMAAHLQGYQSILDEPLKLHVHLPNGRSLARLWWHKQLQRDGEWIDVSDDISSFRQSVLDANETGLPQRGIELGRGGFVIRGIVPIRDSSGDAPTGSLGSVEVLFDMSQILAAAETSTNRSGLGGRGSARVHTLLNRELLTISTQLDNPVRYPILYDHFVLTSGHENPAALDYLNPARLEAARTQLQWRHAGNRFISGLPINDYKGRQVGLFLIEANLSREQGLIKKISLTILVVLGLLMLLNLSATGAALQFLVLLPLKQIRRFSHKLADNNFSARIQIRGAFEMESLGDDLNVVAASLAETARDMKQAIDSSQQLSDALAQRSRQLKEEINKTAAASSQVASTCSELRETAQLTFKQSSDIKSRADSANQQAREGNHAMDQLSVSMTEIRSGINKLLQASTGLQSYSDRIKEIILQIEDLADQTEVLSVNSSIQAIKAGEAGKGFSIVSSEIKQLANQSKSAAASIGQHLQAISKSANQFHQIVGAQDEQAGQTQTLSATTTESIHALADVIQLFDQTAQQLSAASRQQFVGIDQLAHAMDSMRSSSQVHKQTVTELDQSVAQLADIAHQLRQKTEKFRW